MTHRNHNTAPYTALDDERIARVASAGDADLWSSNPGLAARLAFAQVAACWDAQSSENRGFSADPRLEIEFHDLKARLVSKREAQNQTAVANGTTAQTAPTRR